MKRQKPKMTIKEILDQARWLIGLSRGARGSMILLAGMSAVAGLSGVWSALLIRRLIDTAAGTQQGSIAQAALLFVLSMAVMIGLNALESVVRAHALTRQQNRLRSKLYKKALAAEWLSLNERHSGDYVNRMVSDVDVVTGFVLTAVPEIASTLVRLLASSAVLFAIEPMLMILALTVTPVFVLLARLFAGRLREATLRIQGLKSDQLALAQESIQNVVTLRAFERQTDAATRLERLQDKLLFWSVRSSKLGALSETIQSANWAGVYILSLLWGAARLSQGAATYGSVAACLQLAAQIQGPLRQLAGYIPQMVAASASVGRLAEVLDMPEEHCPGPAPAITGPVGITLANVSFAYREGGPVLESLFMEAPPGTMTALVGPTGAGKSTVVRLLLGLIAPQSGNILLTGPDGSILPVSAGTRGVFSYVQQGNTAWSGTIADNLRIARPAATAEEMEAALRLACAWDFVDALKDKLGTRIGERGDGLSEGQQQRLAIARALLRDAPVLILDEATSALDKKTEEQVLKNIQSAFHGRTCLVITHRSAALKLCSQVYKLSCGKAYLSATSFHNNNVKLRVKRSRSYYKAAPAS